MTKAFHTRARALLVSAVMAVSSCAVTSTGSLFANAAGKTYTVNKTLASSIGNPEDEEHPLNETECTFMLAPEANQYTSFTDTPGKTPADLLGTGIKTLKFNLKADDMVTDFSYFFGASADSAHGYW